MSSTSLDSAPSESSTQLPGLSTTSNNQSDSITPDATLKQTDIPPQPQPSINNESLDNNNNNQSQQDKKQTVFEIAQNIEENLNKLLKQLDNTDNEINTKIDLALKNINTLYDKTNTATTATPTNAS